MTLLTTITLRMFRLSTTIAELSLVHELENSNE
jgi:hypothetical protein